MDHITEMRQTLTKVYSKLRALEKLLDHLEYQWAQSKQERAELKISKAESMADWEEETER